MRGRFEVAGRDALLGIADRGIREGILRSLSRDQLGRRMKAVALDAVLSGDALPSYTALGAALFHMATNRAFDAAGMAVAPGFKSTVPWLRDTEGIGTGAHLAVVGEDPPLLTALEVPTLVACGQCKGSGSQDGKSSTCATCRGQGRVRMQQGIFSIQQACPHCAGSGKTIQNPCNSCHGNGRVEDRKHLSVKIPAGVDNGDRIRLGGEGEAGPAGAPAGDLYVEVHVRQHPIFQRDGDDLYCEVPLRFSQAALGAEIAVPTLDGEAVIKVPAETQTGKLFRLRGKGVRSVRSHGTGDLICRVVTETPVNLTPRQRELLAEFEATCEDNASRHSPRSSSFLDGVRSFWERMTS